MEKSKKTLKMIGICIIGLVIVVAVNMLKKPEDPFKNADGVKLGGYQHVEESDILNSKDYDSYYVYFYETGNEKCKDTNEVVKSYVRGKSSIYVFNMEEAKDIKTGKDFDYKNVTNYKDITIKQVPMLIHVENKKIDWLKIEIKNLKQERETLLQIIRDMY